MKHRESQIDPFNAGEPELPWDAPETQTLDDGHECELPEHSYQSPLKTPDAYDAPDTDEPKRPAQSSGTRAQRWRRQGAGAPARPVSSGTDKPRRRGCGCLTIVIIVIALNILLPTLAFIPHCTGVMLEDDAMEITWNTEDTYEDEERQEDEREIEQLAEDTLDGVIAADSRARTLIAANFETAFRDNLGYSVQDLNIDTQQFVDWALTDFDYDITDVYAFDDSESWGEAYGSVFFDATTPDVAAFYNSFYPAARDFLVANNLTDPAAVMPNDEQRSAFQALFTQQLDALRTSRTVTEVANIDFASTNDGWVVKEDYYDSAMQYIFRLY